LSQLDETLGFAPVLGAGGRGAPMFELYNTDAERGARRRRALRPHAGHRRRQGCTPIGAPYVITRAESNVIERIATGRRWRSSKRPSTRCPTPRAHSPGGSVRRPGNDPAKSPLERGDFLVRNLMGADRSSGALAVAERVRVGQTVQFQIRDAEASRWDLRAMPKSGRAARRSASPSAATSTARAAGAASSVSPTTTSR